MQSKLNKCRGCGEILTGADWIADGCTCNNPRGINHGIVPSYVCTCSICDPQQTGSVREKPKTSQIKFREFL